MEDMQMLVDRASDPTSSDEVRSQSIATMGEQLRQGVCVVLVACVRLLRPVLLMASRFRFRRNYSGGATCCHSAAAQVPPQALRSAQDSPVDLAGVC